MNSGTSAHVSPDLTAFTSYTPYDDSEQLRFGNGKGLEITHIGTTSISTNSSTLLLTNVLHVPF
jgi:hypothetical protein